MDGCLSIGRYATRKKTAGLASATPEHSKFRHEVSESYVLSICLVGYELSQQGTRKLLRVEGLQVFELFAHADEIHRHHGPALAPPGMK